jgi:DNA-directed RNA polymerase specialized sigma24 family protein
VDPVPVDQLEREWQRQLASGTVAEHLRSWQVLEPALTPFGSPSGLISYLRNSPSSEQQDAVLGALVRQGRTDPMAATLLLQRLLPGLKRRAGRLILDAGERDQVWSLLLEQLWERIRTFPIERRPRKVAASLLLDSIRDTLTVLATDRRQVARLVAEPPEGLEAPGPETGDVVWLLWDAVHAAAISRDEARLILETRIDGVDLEDAAAQRGVSRHALIVRRVRAERRLFMQLGWGCVTHRGVFSPLCGARVSGAGSKGLAGGEDQPTPPRR